MLNLDNHLWFASLLNAALLAIQLRTTLATKNVDGLSIIMMIGFLYMQVIYAILGVHNHNVSMVIGMTLSAILNLTIIVYAIPRKWQAWYERSMTEGFID